MKIRQIATATMMVIGLASPAFAGSTATVTAGSYSSAATNGNHGAALALSGNASMADCQNGQCNTSSLSQAGGQALGGTTFNSTAGGFGKGTLVSQTLTWQHH